MAEYRATSPKDPSNNYTEEVILEKNDEGEVTKSIRVGGEPVELSDVELETVSRYLEVAPVDAPASSPAGEEARAHLGRKRGGE